METLRQKIEDRIEEKEASVEISQKPGVLSGHRPENGYWRLEVLWRDGEITKSNFPASGFEVFEMNGDVAVGKAERISAKKAEELLNKYASEYDSPDANHQVPWMDFLKKK